MKPSHRALVGWGLLITMFVAIWRFSSPEHPARPDPEAGSVWLRSLLVIGGVTAFIVTMSRLAKAGAAHRRALANAQAYLEAGRYEEAEQALDAPAGSRLPKYRRMAAHMRAEIAARQGLRDEALARVEPAIAGPFGPVFQGGARAAARDARGLRAFLRASAGDEAGAREDIAALRAAEGVEPRLAARAELAAAILLDRAGDRAALREHLDRFRALLFEAAAPHERALLRAYDAMLSAPSTTVYRRKADEAAPDPDDGEHAVRRWVATYAPNAAPFAWVAGGRQTRMDTSPMADPSKRARRKVASARPTMKVKHTRNGKPLAVSVLLIVAFLGIRQLVDGSRWSPIAVAAVVVGGLAGWIYWAIRRQRRDNGPLNASARAIAAGDLDAAAAELATEPRTPALRAHAHHLRAEIATRRGEMSEALAQCDLAFQKLAEAYGTVAQPAEPAPGATIAWDLVRIVTAQRSFALAVLGRDDEARAEIEWARGFPNGLAELRVRLVERLGVHDFEGALAVVEGRERELVLPAREEMLAEILRFAVSPAARGEPEAARIRGELARTPGLERWIEAVAPGLLDAVRVAAAGGGTAS